MEQTAVELLLPKLMEDRSAQVTVDDLHAAQSMMQVDRQKGLAALNGLFRSGQPPLAPST